MESILHHAFRAPFGRHAIQPRIVWHAGVKFRLEGGHQRHARQALAEGTNGRQIDGVVRRGGGQEFFQRAQHAVVDQKRAAVARPGVHRLECHGIHRHAAGADLFDGFPVVAHALEAAPAEHLFRRHLQNLVLQRRGAQIRNEQVHLTP